MKIPRDLRGQDLIKHLKPYGQGKSNQKKILKILKLDFMQIHFVICRIFEIYGALIRPDR